MICLGNLVTTTCPSNTVYYPVLLGGTDAHCATDVNLVYLDVDSVGNTLIVGFVTTSTITTCTTFNINSSGTHYFIALLDIQGNYQWINALDNLDGVPITAAAITSTYAFASIASSYTFRLAKISATSGTVALEMSGDSLIQISGNLVQDMQMRVDDSSNDVYVVMNINTGVFGYSGLDYFYMKLNSNLVPQWAFTMHGTATTPDIKVIGTFVASGNFWQLLNFYTDASTQKYSVQKISKTDGSVALELLFLNSQPAIVGGDFMLNQNESMWFSAIYYGASSYISLQSGFTSSNTIDNFYVANAALSDISLAVSSTSGNFIVVGRVPADNWLRLIEYDYNTGSLLKAQRLKRGTTNIVTNKLLTANKNGYIYIAAESSGYLTLTANIRIVHFKTSDSLAHEESCVNITNLSYNSLSSIASTISLPTTLATPLFTPTSHDITTYFISESSYSLIKSTNANQLRYTLRDVQCPAFCELPIIATPNLIIIDMATQQNTNVSIPLPVFSDCSGVTYKIVSLTTGSGASDPQIHLDTTSTISLLYIFSAINTGDLQLKFTLDYQGISRDGYVTVRFAGLASANPTPKTPSHNINACQESIYPFLYGFSRDVFVKDFTLDEFGNLILVGNSIMTPFGDNSSSYSYGFISLQDQRGYRHWHLRLSFMPWQIGVSCDSVSYQPYDLSQFVYASCQFPSEYFKTTLTLPHLLKVSHSTGAVIYFKKLPNDNFNPDKQKLLGQAYVGFQTAFVTLSFKYSSSQQNIVALKFNEVTNAVTYYNFYNYLNRVDFSAANSALIDNSTDSFFQTRHTGTSKVVILKGLISSGAITQQALLTDMTSADCVYCDLQLYGADKILVPTFSSSSAKTFILYILNKLDLTNNNAVKITFPSSYTLNSATVTSDPDSNIYITAGSSQQYFCKLDSSLTVQYQRLWTGTMVAGFRAYALRSKFYTCVASTLCSSSELYTVFSSILGYASKTSEGVMIFRGTQQDNCFDILDILPSNTTWYPTVVQIATPGVTTSTISNMAMALPTINTDNYPFLYDVHNYLITNTIFSPNAVDQNTWGETVIDGFYKRYPLQNYQCSMVARIRTFQDGSTIKEFKYTGTTSNIIVQPLLNNCQSKQFQAQILDPNLLASFTTPVAMGFTRNSQSSITISLSLASNMYYAQSFRVRYSDNSQTYPDYYFDHSLLVRYYKSTVNITYNQAVNNISECQQSPFPFGLGDGSPYIAAQSILGDSTDLSFYVSGYTSNTNAYTASGEADSDDAFILKSTQTGYIIWMDQINFQQGQKDAALAMALTTGFIYCSVYQPDQTYNANTVVLLKITSNEGKLQWSKKLLVRNLIDQYDIYLSSFYDLMADPRNTSMIMASAFYYWNAGTGHIPGNIMIYDNGTDISSLYDFQYAAIGNQASQADAGQIFFDQEDDIVYLSALLNITAGWYQDIFVQAINAYSGSQIWNFTYPTPQYCRTFQLQPAINVNNFTKYMYVAVQQKTNSILIAQLRKSVGTYVNIKLLQLTQSTAFNNFDIATDQRNGSLIILGQSISYFELIYLNKDLGYIKGPYQLHNQQSPYVTGRYIAAFYDFMYIVYNTNQITSPYGSAQLMIQKKSYYANEIQRFECHGATSYNIYTVIQSYNPTSVTAPASVLYFSNQALWFLPDYQVRMRMLKAWYSTSAKFASDYYDTLPASGFNPTQYCRDFSAAPKPPTYLPYQIQGKTGSILSYTFSSSTFTNCQGDVLSISYPFYDETVNSTFVKSYLTASSAYTIQIDARSSPPYPGVRWVGIITSVNGQSTFSYMPIHIYPTVSPSATVTKPDPQCPDNDQQYPKVIGNDAVGGNTQFHWGDIDQNNGNVVMCGQTTNTLLMTQDYYNGMQNAWITMFDQNGVLFWSFAGTSVNYTSGVNEGATYLCCGFAANTTGIYGLIYIYGNTYYQALVKHEYITGKVLFIVQIQGWYTREEVSYFQIDRTLNYLYFTGKRGTDLSALGLQWNSYIVKIDINSAYPAQQYYTYYQNSDRNESMELISLSVSQTDDYFLTHFVYYDRSYSYEYMMALHLKSTGVQLALKNYRIQSSLLTNSAIYDGTNVFFGECILQYPKTFYLSKLSVPALTFVSDVQTVLNDGYYGCKVSLTSDASYVYGFFYESGFQNKYLIKIRKSDLSILYQSQQVQHIYASACVNKNSFNLLTLYFSFNDKYTNQGKGQNIFVYSSMIYIMYSNYGYIRPNMGAVLNQFTLNLQSTKSCTETISMTPASKPITAQYSDPIGSTLSYYVSYGEVRYPHFPKFYFEYLTNTNYSRVYDSKQMNCNYQTPKFSYDMMTNILDDQILQLPINSASTYTFAWPSDCFSQNLDFFWTIDTYTTAPSFITVTNTSASTTVSMLPSTSNIGTYTFRATFKIRGKYSIQQSYTFAIEVYPEVNYGKQNIACATSNIMAIFNKATSYTEFLMMDMDAAGSTFLMCGRTKDAELSKYTSTYIGFISTYTQGLNLNFFLGLKLGYEVINCQSFFGYQGKIQSVFTHSSDSTSDANTIAFLRHSNLGMYSLGKHFSRYQAYTDIADYQIDLTTGYQYLAGTHRYSQFNRGSESEAYILKLDSTYKFLFFRTYCQNYMAYYYSTMGSLRVQYTSTNIYLAFWYYRNTFYAGMMSTQQTDGSIDWANGLQNINSYSTNYLQSNGDTPIGQVLAGGNIYMGTYYYTYYILNYGTSSQTSNTGYELYLIKLNPSTGAIIEAKEWSFTDPVQSIKLDKPVSDSSYIVYSWGIKYQNFIALFTINTASITLKQTVLSVNFYTTSNFYYFRTFFFERNATMWGFSRHSDTWSGSSSNYGLLYRFSDYSGMTWYQPCNQQSTITSYFVGANIDYYGIGGQFVASGNWTNLLAGAKGSGYQLEGVWNVPSKLFYRWYTNIQNFTSFPITNSSANSRVSSGSCLTQSAPTAPSVALNRVGVTVNSSYGGFQVMNAEQDVILPVFNQCSGDSMTYSLTFSNGSALSVGSLFQFSSTALILQIFAYSNTYVAIYALTYTSALTSNSALKTSMNFQVQINQNQAPTAQQNFPTSVRIYAHQSYTWTVQFDVDKEQDTPYFNVQLINYYDVNVNSTISYLYVDSSDDTGIVFSVINPNQTLSSATPYSFFTLQVLVWDDFNVATPNIYNISLTILPNLSPYLYISYNQYLPTIFITQSFKFTIWYQNFTDTQTDTKILTNSVSTDNVLNDATWVNIEVNQTVPGNITFYGRTPRNNYFSGRYSLQIRSKDQWDGSPNYYYYYLDVYPKQQIELVDSLYDNLITQVPNSLTSSFSTASSDPLGEPNFYSLYINSTLYNETALKDWIQWDNITQNITVTPYSNKFIGIHSICIRFDDFITSPRYINFTIEIIPNWPLIPLVTEVPNRVGIVDNWFFFDYDQDLLFQNPEANPFTMYFRQADNGNALPYFVNRNFSNGTFGGYPSQNDVGSYTMECVGVDDALWETVYTFMLVIKPCYYKCKKCWDAEYNTCTGCKPNYFLYNSECVDICIEGTYADSNIWKCMVCPTPCKTCFGPNTTFQCPTCTPGYFYLKNGCYDKCPDGYYADKTDYTCKQLYATSDLGAIQKMGYLLQGTSCIIPKCIDGQYFNWYPMLVNGVASGRCASCNSRCKQCEGPLDTQCSSCYPGALLSQTYHNCTLCEELRGYFTNEMYQCEDICGDGIIIDKQCDDGNVLSEDGCSNLCKLEYGFNCNAPNQSCIENIPPFFTISGISAINQVFVKFSEPIEISNAEDISKQNLDVEITGSLDTYQFSWRLIENPSSPLLPDRKITQFSIIIEDYLQSMDGSEIITLSFKNASVIKDLVRNQLTDNYVSSVNANSYVYISASEAGAASGGGSSMKYTFLSVFSFNLILKVALSSSMQYLWGLVHALQVFSFLLYMNIDLPENVSLFTQYFSVASGDMSEFDAYIPNIANYIIDEDRIIEKADDAKLSPKFYAAEISPYFIIAYGQKLTIWAFAFLILLPSIMLMNKLCKKVKLWENIKGSFFFNSPLRGFVEQYLEFIVQLVLNSQFIKFKNRDQVIASGIAFFFGAASLLLPFITMSVIYKNRKKVKSILWKKQYGMLTEECQSRSILQLYYYPLFVYQRLMIAGILVYVYDYPFIQCVLVIAFSLGMVSFLVIVRPFEEENQQTTTVLDEFVIIICVMLFGYLESRQDYINNDQKKNLGWVIVAFICFSVIKNFTVVIYFGIMRARKSIFKMFGQEDLQKDSPHTSDEEDIINLNQNQQSLGEFDTEELKREILNEKFEIFTQKVSQNNQLQTHEQQK